MKGVFFDPPLESRIEIAGEEFRQGDTLNCSLAIKNRGSETRHFAGVRLELARGEFKKVKAKAAGAFSSVAVAELESISNLAPDETKSFSWSFCLDKNCEITDNAGSLYVLYGPQSASSILGQLQINVHPHSYIVSLLELFESSFQFVLKSKKSSKGWIVAKFKPSSARRFNRLEELALSVQFQGDTLALKYAFKKKSLEATATALEVKKLQQSHEQQLARADYLLGNFPNYQGMEVRIEEALQTVASPI